MAIFPCIYESLKPHLHAIFAQRDVLYLFADIGILECLVVVYHVVAHVMEQSGYDRRLLFSSANQKAADIF